MQAVGSIPAIICNNAGRYEGDLKYYFKVVFNHAKNLANPYHNFRHLFHVLYLCSEACGYYHTFAISKREARDLLIAAIFHDFDHPGRTGNDDLNIEISLRALRKHILPEDKPFLGDIEYLIKCTEFPYRVPSIEISFLACVLRDADMAQVFSIAWIQQIIFGLANEMNMTPRKVLEMQESFLSAMSFNTKWATETFNNGGIQSKVEEARALLSILDND